MVSSTKDYTISFRVSGEIPNEKNLMVLFVCFLNQGGFSCIFPRNFCWERFFGEKKNAKQLGELYKCKGPEAGPAMR